MLSENDKWYRVSLIIKGTHLAVDEIETKIGLVPSKIGRKGELISNKHGTARYRLSFWRWSSSSNSDICFENQINELLDLLEPKKAIFQELVLLSNNEAELFLGFSSGNGQGGAFFSTNLLKRIVEFGLALNLDLYPPTIDEEN